MRTAAYTVDLTDPVAEDRSSHTSTLVVLARQLSNSSPTALQRVVTAYRRLDLTQPATRQLYRTMPKRARWLTYSELERLVSGYEAGATVYQLAEEFSIHRATVGLHLKRQGVAVRNQSPTPAQVNEMVRLYRSGLSLSIVGQRLNFDAATVLRHLRARGLRMRDTHGR